MLSIVNSYSVDLGNTPLQYFKTDMIMINMIQDVLNYEEFVRHFSSDEQQQLLKYLAPVDSFAPPDRFIQSTSYLYSF